MNETLPTLEQMARQAGQLYSLPAVALEVLELTSSDQVDTRRLKLCIENDPALTTKILRVVNSSLFGLTSEVHDLHQALALLGTKPLKLLVLGFSLPEQLFDGASTDALARYWRLSLTKAVAARQIGKTSWGQEGDDAFIAGLLEDVGQLVLLQDLGGPYELFVNRVAEIGCDLCQAEVDVLGFDHRQLSAALLSQWKLPRRLVAAIGRPTSARELALLAHDEAYLPQVLHLADLASRLVAESRLALLPELLEQGERFCRLDGAKWKSLVAEIEENVAALSEALSLSLPADRDYCQILADAHTLLSEVAGDAVGDLLDARIASPEERLSREARELATAARRLVGQQTTTHAHESAALVEAQQRSTPNDVAALSRSSAAAGVATVGVDAELLGLLTSAAVTCRQQRCELSLMLVAFDEVGRLETEMGPAALNKIGELLRTSWRGMGESRSVSALGGGMLAIILPAVDRQQAVALGNQFMRELSERAKRLLGDRFERPSIGVGIASTAVIAKNFRPADLVEAAERCLHGARTFGGDALKSIEIY